MAKHKYIKTPEKMWELFEDYRKEIKENPKKDQVFGGKDFDERQKNLERPLTQVGFRAYCAENICDIQRYWYNADNEYDEYVTIITRIKDIIRADQIEGGMVGQYNSNLTARLNSLTDKQQHDVNVTRFDFDGTDANE